MVARNFGFKVHALKVEKLNISHQMDAEEQPHGDYPSVVSSEIQDTSAPAVGFVGRIPSGTRQWSVTALMHDGRTSETAPIVFGISLSYLFPCVKSRALLFSSEQLRKVGTKNYNRNYWTKLNSPFYTHDEITF